MTADCETSARMLSHDWTSGVLRTPRARLGLRRVDVRSGFALGDKIEMLCVFFMCNRTGAQTSARARSEGRTAPALSGSQSRRTQTGSRVKGHTSFIVLYYGSVTLGVDHVFVRSFVIESGDNFFW